MSKAITITTALAMTIAFTFAVTASAFAVKPDVQTLNGGGQIVDGDHYVSFGGNIKDYQNKGLKGQFQANFHNVSDEDVSGGKFHSTEITDANWFEANSSTCTGAMNATMTGKFNGENGWELVLRAGDNEDTVRLTLTSPEDDVYDTHAADFAGESSCVGSARTGLDNGNITIGL